MVSHLERVAKTYDRCIVEFGNEDAPDYDNLPGHITSDPDYPAWKAEAERQSYKSECKKEIKDFLSPAKGMNFIQLGCSLNLMFKGYDRWPSAYYGVDISGQTIRLLNDFIKKNNISVGALHCGSIHDTPFADSFFDIGECIGVLEYYERAFVLEAVREFHRILKPGGRFVLDIPNSASPSGRMAMLIEGYMGRPDLFDMTPREFEDMIEDYFEIEDSDRMRANHAGAMYHYYLRCKKS